MRRTICALLLCMALSTSVGCFVPIYDGNPTRRTQQLIFTSENLRALRDEWDRIWMLDMPDHMTPHRVHGGII